MAGATEYTMRDLYPDYFGYLTVTDRSNPEPEEQAAYGEARTGGPAGARAFGQVDFWKMLGAVAALGAALVLVGIVRGE